MVADGSLAFQSQSLKDQGKSRTRIRWKSLSVLPSRNPLKIRASLEPTGFHAMKRYYQSQSLKDQGKSRTLDSLAFARRQSFSLRKH